MSGPTMLSTASSTRGVTHDLVDPCQQQMTFRAQGAVGQPAGGLDVLELAAIVVGLGRDMTRIGET